MLLVYRVRLHLTVHTYEHNSINFSLIDERTTNDIVLKLEELQWSDEKDDWPLCWPWTLWHLRPSYEQFGHENYVISRKTFRRAPIYSKLISADSHA